MPNRLFILILFIPLTFWYILLFCFLTNHRKNYILCWHFWLENSICIFFPSWKKRFQQVKFFIKVESILLQICLALGWNFSQTIFNFFLWHPLFWLFLLLVACHCLLFCFKFYKKCLGKVPPMSWVNLK